jgi:hypothetical protein
MKVKDIVLQLLRKNLKGVQLFRKEDIPQIIKKFDLIPCNDIDMRDDVLVVCFDDQVLYVQLTWEQLGPRNTLVGVDWKSN